LQPFCNAVAEESLKSQNRHTNLYANGLQRFKTPYNGFATVFYMRNRKKKSKQPEQQSQSMLVATSDTRQPNGTVIEIGLLIIFLALLLKMLGK
jgi:hypothetical protein